jgi:putative ABC transport system permease protein
LAQYPSVKASAAYDVRAGVVAIVSRCHAGGYLADCEPDPATILPTSVEEGELHRAMGRVEKIGPLWIKAPLVLLRFPRLLLSVGFGAFLLCMAVAVEPLFISAEASHLLAGKIAQPTTTRYGAGLLFQLQVAPLPFAPHSSGTGLAPRLAEIDSRFSKMTRPLLGPVIRTELGPDLIASTPGQSGSEPLALFSGTDVLGQVDVLERGSSTGVWLADLTARSLGVSPGATITITNGPTHGVSVPVAGIYRALVNEPRSGYWQPWEQYIDPRCVDCSVPPPFALADHATLDRLFAALGIYSETYGWQAPVASGSPLALDQAGSIAMLVTRFEDQASDPSSVFACCETNYAGRYQLTARISSDMPSVVSSVQRDMASRQGSAQVVQAAGVLVALVVIGAAAVFAFTARKVEAQLLFARGVHPMLVGVKASLESLLPALSGGMAGTGLSFLLVRLLRSDGSLSRPAIWEAISRAGLGALVGLVVFGIVSGVAFTAISSAGSTRSHALARVPWELALVALAGYALHRIQTGGAFEQGGASQVRHPSVFVLLFPVLEIGGVGMLLTRVFKAAVDRLRGRSDGFRSWAYLAVRRLAGGARLPLLLVAASALALGTLVEAEATVRSVQTTVSSKAHLFVGSDVQAQASYDTPLPERFPLPITKVTLAPEAGTLSPGGETFDLLAIDPSTFARAAFWTSGLSDLSLQQILGRLSENSDTGLPVAIALNGAAPTSGLDIETRTIPIRTVATLDAFPGMVAGVPLVVVDTGNLLRAIAGLADPLVETPGASTEFWVKGPTSEALPALGALGFGQDSVLTATQVEDIPEISAVVGSLLVLEVLGLAMAFLAVIGMLAYLAARQRSQAVSYGLSVRMGMSHSDHRKSLVAELAAMICSSYVIGVALALVAALVLVPKLDPLSTIPPRPTFVVPGGPISLLFLALLGFVWLGAWLTNRRTRALDLGEVMRVAG